MVKTMKAALRKAKGHKAVSEPVQQEPIAESKPSPTVPDLGNALRQAGSGFVPTVSNVGDSPKEPITVTPAEPQSSPVEQKVVAFIKLCHLTSGLTYREIASGCDLQIADVKVALASLVASGTLSHSDEAEPNYRRYNLATPVPVAAPPAEPICGTAELWNREAQRRHREEMAAKQPPIVRSTVPPLDEIVLPEPAKPLTPEERRLHDSLIPKNRVSRNPQEYVKR